jgi:hypothetical protein
MLSNSSTDQIVRPAVGPKHMANVRANKLCAGGPFRLGGTLGSAATRRPGDKVPDGGLTFYI